MIPFSLFILISAVIGYVVYYYVTRKNLPPGPPRWPIIGNVIELLSINKVQKYPHLTLNELSRKYGDVMTLAFGVHDAVVISSYEAMRDLLMRDDMLGRYAFPFAIDRAFGLPWLGGLVWSDMWVWKELRKHSKTSLKHFGFEQVPMDNIIREKMDQLISRTKSSVEENNGIFQIDSLALTAMASSVIFKMVADIDFAFDNKTFLQMLKHSTTEIRILNFTNIYNLFPFLRHWFPKWTHHDEHMLIYKELQDFMKGRVIETVKAKRAERSINDQKPTNYVEEFLDKIEENKFSDSPTVYTDEQNVLMLMDLLGGAEVMSPVLQWSLLYLSLNPNVQTRVREEINAKWDEIEKVDASISQLISQMPYTKATMYEIHRCSNLTPLPPPRKALDTFEYKDYEIQKGSLIIWNLHPIMTDETYWGDPEVFRPERFLDAENKITRTERMVTFGFGKRVCYGQKLADHIMFTGIAYFLRTFDLEVIPGKEPSPENPYKALALAPRRFSLKATVRNN